MSNVVTIARKEFSDLLTNGMVVLVLGVYLVYIVYCLFTFSTLLSSSGSLAGVSSGDNIGVTCASFSFDMLRNFLIIGVIIGCASISNEVHSHSVNILLVKPVYRDTIINGKLLGALAFIALILAVTILFFIAGVLVIGGNAFAPYLGQYIEWMAVAFFVFMIYFSIFTLLSMFVSIVVRSQAFSLMIGVILVFLSQTISSTAVGGNLGLAIPGADRMIASLTPDGLLVTIIAQSLYLSGSLDVLGDYWQSFLGLVVFLVVSLVLCYIAFLWRDVQ